MYGTGITKIFFDKKNLSKFNFTYIFTKTIHRGISKFVNLCDDPTNLKYKSQKWPTVH